MIELPPWSNRQSWKEMSLYLGITRHSDRDFTDVLNRVNHLAELFDATDDQLNSLCGLSCGSCGSICCQLATVWYDLRDLLFSLFYFDCLPPGQITRRKDGRCEHLFGDGCRLERKRRPFICTWYICQQQTDMLLEMDPEWNSAGLMHHLKQMQDLRIDLEDCFVQTVCR